MFWPIILSIFRSTRLCVTGCGIMDPRCCLPTCSDRRGDVRWRVQMSLFITDESPTPRTKHWAACSVPFINTRTPLDSFNAVRVRYINNGLAESTDRIGGVKSEGQVWTSSFTYTVNPIPLTFGYKRHQWGAYDQIYASWRAWAVLHYLSLVITYILTARRLLHYRSFFPVKMRLNGKGFDGSTALLRTDRHWRQIAGNVTQFPELQPRSVPIRDIMEVLLNILDNHRLCCHLSGSFVTYITKLFINHCSICLT